MKRAEILLVFLLLIAASCSDERIVLEKQPIAENCAGGISFAWSISQKSSGDRISVEVTTYVYESTRNRYVRKIYLREEISGAIAVSCVDISKEDWDRVENMVKGVFTSRPDTVCFDCCDCCDETLPYRETLEFIHGNYTAYIDSIRIEGCTGEDIEVIRGLFKELKESYFPEENTHEKMPPDSP